MGKGDKTRSRAARAAHRAGVPEIAPVPRKVSDGHGSTKHSKAPAQRDEAAVRATVYKTRARRLGVDVSDNRVTSQMAETDAGCAILLTLDGDDALKAYQAMTGYQAVERRYRIALLGKTGEPNSMRLEHLPDNTFMQDDPAFDDRTEDEKCRDAVNGYMRWQGYFGKADPSTKSHFLAVMSGRSPAMHGSQTTSHGHHFAHAALELWKVAQEN